MERHVTALLVCLVLAVISPTAALGGTGRFELSIQGGAAATQADYYAEQFSDEGSDFGPNLFGGVGVAVTLDSQRHLSLESGLFYCVRGGETDFRLIATDEEGQPVWQGTGSADWRTSYLAVPLCLKYSFNERGVGLYVEAGAEVALLLSADAEIPMVVAEDPPEIITVGHDAKDEFTEYDIAAIVGAGWDVPIGRATAFVELSFVFGMTDVLDVPEPVAFDAQLRNRSLELALGVWF